MRVKINHHATTLYARLGHILYAQSNRVRGAALISGLGHTRIFSVSWALNILPSAIAVVVDGLRDAIAIRIKQRTDVRQTVPLR